MSELEDASLLVLLLVLNDGVSSHGGLYLHFLGGLTCNFDDAIENIEFCTLWSESEVVPGRPLLAVVVEEMSNSRISIFNGSRLIRESSSFVDPSLVGELSCLSKSVLRNKFTEHIKNDQ